MKRHNTWCDMLKKNICLIIFLGGWGVDIEQVGSNAELLEFGKSKRRTWPYWWRYKLACWGRSWVNRQICVIYWWLDFVFSFWFKWIKSALNIPERWGQTESLQPWSCCCWINVRAGRMSQEPTITSENDCYCLSVYHGNTLFVLLPQKREPPQNLLHFSQEAHSRKQQWGKTKHQLDKKTRKKKYTSLLTFSAGCACRMSVPGYYEHVKMGSVIHVLANTL